MPCSNRKNILRHLRSLPVVFQLSIVLFSLISCNRKINFEKNKWDETTDPVFPSVYRPQMLEDLTTNHKLIGLSYKELVNFLGSPDYKELNSIVYNIVVDYGSDIDPVYYKKMEFSYSKDSVITSFRIMEWKK
ncbi:hypothetical protein HDE69_000811 [Pedobacter cryoconitis]|uniref:Lipoprotein SmpA/OmlA domain-containing protein n=1 Tax=Pedobacter cryoconitis TaxID=188932 RepID=A0A7W8YQ57_9SPHI|nr:hypothetical protein [Pedobacter cryoconitis]